MKKARRRCGQQSPARFLPPGPSRRGSTRTAGQAEPSQLEPPRALSDTSVKMGTRASIRVPAFRMETSTGERRCRFPVVYPHRVECGGPGLLSTSALFDPGDASRGQRSGRAMVCLSRQVYRPGPRRTGAADTVSPHPSSVPPGFPERLGLSPGQGVVFPCHRWAGRRTEGGRWGQGGDWWAGLA